LTILLDDELWNPRNYIMAVSQCKLKLHKQDKTPEYIFVKRGDEQYHWRR